MPAVSGTNAALDGARTGGVFKRMTPAEAYCAAYFLAMFIPMTLATFECTSRDIHLVMNAAALVAAVGAQRIRLGYARVFVPLLLGFFAYRQVHYLWIEFNPCSFDYELQRIDSAWFHPVVSLVDAIRGRILSDVMALAYISYYPIVAITTVYLLLKRQGLKAFEYMSLMALLLLVSFVGYYVIPARGPHFFTGREEILNGFGISSLVHSFIMTVEWAIPDAFPSGHVMINVATLWFVWKSDRFLFRIYLLPVVLLVVSTMYLRYHYVVDVAAGLALVPICIFVNNHFCKVHPLTGIMPSDGSKNSQGPSHA